jgi:uncharacterized protein (TIGR03435 family)
MRQLAVTWGDIEPIANHLWQSTLVLTVCAGLAVLLRRNRAHVRHWLWLAASLKFVVPFVILAQLGRLLPSSASVASAIGVPSAAGLAVQPFAPILVPLATSPAVDAQSSPDVWSLLPTAMAIVWLLGAVAMAAVWYVRWRRLRAVAAAAIPSHDGREVAILRALEARAGHRRPLTMRMTDAALEPGVFGVWRPVLLWPRGISSHLDDGQIEAVLAHELAHVERQDNLKAALHMAVQALFWFHPLVWWLGARLIEERERACDEAVLQRGSDPETYAEGILKTCEFSVESPLACVAGVTGADLRRRIEQIMEGRIAGRLSLGVKLFLACVACLVVIVPAFAISAHHMDRIAGRGVSVAQGVGRDSRPGNPEASAAFAPPSLHQYSLLGALHRAAAHVHRYTIDRLFGLGRDDAPQAAAPASSPDPSTAAFEVASVKPNKSGDGPVQIGMQLTRFTAVNVPLRQLIVFAYGVQPYQVDGGPGWLTTERFDITARIPDRFANVGGRLGEIGPINYMMQKLLADRFKLVVERSSKEAQVYELRLARADGKLGAALTRSTVDCAALLAQARAGGPPPSPRADGAQPCGLMMGPANFAGGSMPIAQLAKALSGRVGRPVIDKTGLTGGYDFSLTFAPEFGGPGGGAPPTPPPGAPPLPPIDPNAPNLFTALQEQLGLKLESARGPVDTIVIKSVEMPAAD